MPQIIALVVSVKSGLGGVKVDCCSGVHSLTSTSWLSFVISAVGVVVAKLLLEEVGLIFYLMHTKYSGTVIN